MPDQAFHSPAAMRAAFEAAHLDIPWSRRLAIPAWAEAWDAFVRVWVAATEAERGRCCALVFGHCDSDNVAQRTVDAIRGDPPTDVLLEVLGERRAVRAGVRP